MAHSKFDNGMNRGCEVCHESVDDDFLLVNPLIQYCLCKLTPEQQAAIYRLLRGAKVALWQDIRKLAQEGKAKERSRWGTFTTAIFQMAKQHKEKMP